MKINLNGDVNKIIDCGGNLTYVNVAALSEFGCLVICSGSDDSDDSASKRIWNGETWDDTADINMIMGRIKNYTIAELEVDDKYIIKTKDLKDGSWNTFKNSQKNGCVEVYFVALMNKSLMKEIHASIMEKGTGSDIKITRQTAYSENIDRHDMTMLLTCDKSCKNIRTHSVNQVKCFQDGDEFSAMIIVSKSSMSRPDCVRVMASKNGKDLYSEKFSERRNVDFVLSQMADAISIYTFISQKTKPVISDSPKSGAEYQIICVLSETADLLVTLCETLCEKSQEEFHTKFEESMHLLSHTKLRRQLMLEDGSIAKKARSVSFPQFACTATRFD